MNRNFWFFLILMLLVVGCGKRQTPKLIVYISIDQMRADYLSDSLYGQFFTNDGFKKLMKNGNYFTSCFHEHACTMTGPGHATLGTGAYAHKTGIVANEFYDAGSASFNYCVFDSTSSIISPEGLVSKKYGVSPNYLLISSVGDEVKKMNPNSKIFSASIKDRAAILMGGKNPDGVFWYHSKYGGMVSSTFYFDTLPDWIKNFNENMTPFIEHIAKAGWKRMLNEEQYIALLGPDDRAGEVNRKTMGTVFPHYLTSKDSLNMKEVSSNIRYTPYGDELLLKFAKELITKEQLGKDENPDVLTLSFSATDYIGHTFGPYSHEMMDQIVRLDQMMGELISFLDENIGSEHYILALSADHGVCPLPEYLESIGIESGRIDGAKVDSLLAGVFNNYGIDSPIKKITSNYVYLNEKALNKYQKHRDSILKEMKQKIKAIQGIATIYDETEILAFPETDKIKHRIKQSYYKDRSGHFYILVKPYYFFGYPGSKGGTTHGTPYEYDAKVPCILYGNGLNSSIIHKKIGTADIAVTLINLAGVKQVYNDRDGKMLFK
ncbi:MAG: alkaline phosphatase family protein [Calditrichia bacterium]